MGTEMLRGQQVNRCWVAPPWALSWPSPRQVHPSTAVSCERRGVQPVAFVGGYLYRKGQEGRNQVVPKQVLSSPAVRAWPWAPCWGATS